MSKQTPPRFDFVNLLRIITLVVCILLMGLLIFVIFREFIFSPRTTQMSMPASQPPSATIEPTITSTVATITPSKVTISFWGGDRNAPGRTIDDRLVEQFELKTGIIVNSEYKPLGVTEAYQELLDELESDEPPDVVALDVIWLGAVANRLIDIRDLDTSGHYRSVLESNTVQGKLLAMPWFVNIGLLYYRPDLLEKYGFEGPPTTWDQLEAMAQKIQVGEREETDEFWGFVWQNNQDEGLTCNVLEWIASSGGDVVQDGQVTINSPNTIRALERAQRWVGPEGISPVNYTNDDAERAFFEGRAAFLRSWTTAYSNPNADVIDFDIAPLPHSVGALGGAVIGVVNTTDNVEEAKQFVVFMTSEAAQEERANSFFVPSRPAISEGLGTTPNDKKNIEKVVDIVKEVTFVNRPSIEFGEKYEEASRAIYENVYSMLTRGEDVMTVVSNIEKGLQAALPRPSQ